MAIHTGKAIEDKFSSKIFCKFYWHPCCRLQGSCVGNESIWYFCIVLKYCKMHCNLDFHLDTLVTLSTIFILTCSSYSSVSSEPLKDDSSSPLVLVLKIASQHRKMNWTFEKPLDKLKDWNRYKNIWKEWISQWIQNKRHQNDPQK